MDRASNQNKKENTIKLPDPFPCASCDISVANAKVYSSEGRHTLSFDFSQVDIPKDREPFVMILTLWIMELNGSETSII